LLSNAVKFSKGEGNILIKVEYIKMEKQCLKVSVIDTGIGIKEEDKPKLFKMFGSIKDQKNKVNTSGIGLGLVISKLIVNKFDGHINFFSEQNKGSNFFFTFEIKEFDRTQFIEQQELKLLPISEIDKSKPKIKKASNDQMKFFRKHSKHILALNEMI
jgi:K+-sensing histidine kinase KdpD